MNNLSVGVFLILLISFFGSSAQVNNLSLEGRIIDYKSNEPISQAQIQVQYSNNIVFSNVNGAFTLLLADKSANSTLIISCVGYASQSVMLENNHQDSLLIKLKPFYHTLKEVMVKPPLSDKRAENMVEKAMKLVKKQIPSFEAFGYYHNHLKENGRYVKLTEGKVLLKEPFGYGRKKSEVMLSEDIYYLEKRQSLDHSFNRLGFKRSYYDTYFQEFAFLLKNGLKYERAGVNYSYFIEDSIISDKYTDYTIIGFDKNKQSENSFQEYFDLTLGLRAYHDTKTTKVISFQMDYESSLSRKFMTHTENSHFLINLKDSAQFSVPVSIEHMLIQRTKHIGRKTNIEMQAYQRLDLTSVTFDRKGYLNKPPENSVYDPSFWREKSIPIDVRRSLSSFIDLEDQFQQQHNTEWVALNQEKIKVSLIDKYLQKGSSKDIFLVFWKDFNTLGKYLQLPDKFDMSHKTILFIGLLEGYQDWCFIINSGDYQFYPHFYLPSKHMDIKGVDSVKDIQQTPLIIHFGDDFKGEIIDSIY